MVFKPVDPFILKSKVAVLVDLYLMTEEVKRQSAYQQWLLDEHERVKANKTHKKKALSRTEARQEAILPRIKGHAHIYFRHLRCANRKEEALAEVTVQPVDLIGHHTLLLVHRNDDVEDRHRKSARDERCVGPGLEAKRVLHGEVCHETHGRVADCVGRWRRLCASYEFFGAAVRSYNTTPSTLIGA